MDATTLQYSIILIAQQGLHLHLMDYVTTYLYGSFENHIYMKILEGFYLPNNANFKEDYSVKLNKSLYGLKQLRRMWYNHLSEYLLKEGYKNDPISPCIYMKKFENEFSIIIVYVNDINIVETPNELTKAIDCLKKGFEMKDIEKEFFFLRLQIKYLNKDVFIHKEACIIKVCKMF